jgi:predicted MFS family arabinose efflux permease
VVVVILILGRRIADPIPADPSKPFDAIGAALSGAGMFLVVLGILVADNDARWMVALLAAGAVLLAAFVVVIRRTERRGGTPLLSTAVFRNRVANLGLVTQNAQWLILMGTSFTVATYLQVVRGYNAIETGVIFTAATLGILVSSLAAERLAKRRPQRTLILAGFVVTVAGIGLLIGLVAASDRIIAFVPGLLLVGLGLGVMLTPSVNLVQSSFTEGLPGEISGLSRSISNLGSSFGTAIAGTVLVSGLADGNRSYALAMAVLAAVGVIGLGAAAFIPRPRAGVAQASTTMAAAR